MDAYIEKTNTSANNELVMFQDYFNGHVSESFGHSSWSGISSDEATRLVWGQGSPREGVTGSFNGKYFGPNWNVNKNAPVSGFSLNDYRGWYQNATPFLDCDPGPAPCTPPYFYGKAKVRLIYTGSIDDTENPGNGKGPNWRKILNNMTMSFKSDDDPRHDFWDKFDYDGAFNKQQRRENYTAGAAWQNMMDVTASLNLKGILAPDPNQAGGNRWVISPHMETPVLDFSESQTPERGYARRS